MNLSDAADEFLLALKADGMREKTIIWYRYIVRNAFTAGRESVGLTEMGARAMRAYLVSLESRYSSPSTLHAHRRALHRFWGWCSVEFDIPNPMRNIAYGTAPRPTEPKAVSVFDAVRMLEACGDGTMGIRDRAIIAFLLDTGARAGGLTGLTVDRLDTERCRALVVEKRQKMRYVYWTETTSALLTRWIEVRERVETVFHNHRGQPLTPNGLLQMHYRRAADAGVTGRCNPHAFRHGFAREYLKSGGDLATLSRILGHSDVSVTAAFYGVFTDDELARAHRSHSPMNAANRVMKKPPGREVLRESG